jgi:hypothetical protein
VPVGLDNNGKTIDELPEDVGARIDILIVGIVCPQQCSGWVIWLLQLAALAS